MRDHVQKAENQRICRLVHQAIARGDLVRPTSCAWCDYDGPKIDAHHPDYDRPLMVVWICERCHAAHHARYRLERELMLDFEGNAFPGNGSFVTAEAPCPLT